MKKIGIFFLLLSFSAFSQNYNTKKGVVAEGYDVVAYFNDQAIKGNKKFISEFEEVFFQFSSKENLDTFNTSPQSYVPQYGGFCAYAIGVKGEKVAINPKTFEIREGKLYLFYNSWGTNTLDLWKQEGAEKLQKQADENWEKIKNEFD